MKLIVIFFILTLLLNSCRKEKEYVVELPVESSSGKNTLGFIQNGTKVWSSIEWGVFFLYNKPDNIPNAEATIYTELNGTKSLELDGEMKIKNNNAEVINNSSFSVGIADYNMMTGNYYFDTLSLNITGIATFIDNISSKFYTNYTDNTFSLNINFIDTTEKIISGNFSGILYRKNGTTYILNDSIKIDQGRFDIKYQIYP